MKTPRDRDEGRPQNENNHTIHHYGLNQGLAGVATNLQTARGQPPNGLTAA
jgi:hypothetical protein